jgi:hypothetical protein
MISLAIGLMLAKGFRHRLGSFAALAAFVVHLQWLLLSGDRRELLAGYYLWTISFLLVGLGLWRQPKAPGARQDDNLTA